MPGNQMKSFESVFVKRGPQKNKPFLSEFRLSVKLDADKYHYNNHNFSFTYIHVLTFKIMTSLRIFDTKLKPKLQEAQTRTTYYLI